MEGVTVDVEEGTVEVVEVGGFDVEVVACDEDVLVPGIHCEYHSLTRLQTAPDTQTFSLCWIQR